MDQVKTIRGIKEFVIVGGSSDSLYAIDADTGKLAWKKTFAMEAKPSREPNTLRSFFLTLIAQARSGPSPSFNSS